MTDEPRDHYVGEEGDGTNAELPEQTEPPIEDAGEGAVVDDNEPERAIRADGGEGDEDE